jgi:hypothetical protein
VEEGQPYLGIAVGIVNGLKNPYVLAPYENVTNDIAEKHKETAEGRVLRVPFHSGMPLFFGAFFRVRAHFGHAKTLKRYGERIWDNE